MLIEPHQLRIQFVQQTEKMLHLVILFINFLFFRRNHLVMMFESNHGKEFNKAVSVDGYDMVEKGRDIKTLK